MEILLIIIGWFIVQAYGVQKGIAKSKDNFNIVFFFRDTWLKVVVALALSLGLAAGFYFTIETTDAVYEWGFITFNFNRLIYVVIGAVPEFVLQKLRNKFGILKANK